MENKGKLVVISGFSGAGKGTLMKALMKEYGDSYALSVSATTRNPRPGEMDGVDYFFVTKDKFEQMIAEDALIEYAQYVGNYYGTPKEYVQQQLDLGKNVILEIEIQGALKIKEKFPDTVLMFVTAPNANELKNRLVGRGTETPEVIAARLSRACEESMGMEKYDYLVINDTIENGISLIDRLICDERSAFRLFERRMNMIHPSYVELMKVVNGGVEIGEEPVVNSRYSIVLATAKRARQIIAGAEPLIDNPKCNKPLSIAVEELYRGAVKIQSEDEENN